MRARINEYNNISIYEHAYLEELQNCKPPAACRNKSWRCFGYLKTCVCLECLKPTWGRRGPQAQGKEGIENVMCFRFCSTSLRRAQSTLSCCFENIGGSSCVVVHQGKPPWLISCDANKLGRAETGTVAKSIS